VISVRGITTDPGSAGGAAASSSKRSERTAKTKVPGPPAQVIVSAIPSTDAQATRRPSTSAGVGRTRGVGAPLEGGASPDQPSPGVVLTRFLPGRSLRRTRGIAASLVGGVLVATRTAGRSDAGLATVRTPAAAKSASREVGR